MTHDCYVSRAPGGGYSYSIVQDPVFRLILIRPDPKGVLCIEAAHSLMAMVCYRGQGSTVPHPGPWLPHALLGVKKQERSVWNMKVLVGAFNKKKALVAPPIIVKTFAKFRCKLY